MSPTVRSPLLLAAQLAAAVAGVWLVTPPQRTTPVRVLSVAVFVVVAGRAVARVRGRRPEPRLQHRPVDLGPPGEHRVRLARLETSLTYASTSAQQFDRTVRPLLRDLAVERLTRRRGIDPTTSPAAARAVLGEELWQLLQDPRARVAGVPGPTPAELDRLVAALEAV